TPRTGAAPCSPCCPNVAPTCSCLRPAPVSASPHPGTADGAVGLARWLLPCLASPGACQHPGGPLLDHGAPVEVCGPARLWTSAAGTALAGRARAVPSGAGVGWRIPWGFGTPRPLPAETDCGSIGLLLPGCVLPGTGSGRVLPPLSARPDAGVK